MNLMKSLYLGSAAGLVVMSGAHAADLPLKAKAVEYVKVCSLYGAAWLSLSGEFPKRKPSGSRGQRNFKGGDTRQRPNPP